LTVGPTLYKSIARDVDAMVFVLDGPDGRSQIWRADLDGGTPIQLTRGEAATKPDVSPDGKWVVYVSAIDGALWKIPYAGGQPTRLAPGTMSDPAVSPDGRWVAALFRESVVSPWVPVLISLEDGGISRTLPLPEQKTVSHVRFSRDGAALDVALNDNHAGNVWRLPLDGGQPIQLTQFAGNELRSFDWSWDGKLLACERGGWRGDIVLLRGGW
jgi:Tol biopolymer transport system component